MAPKLRIRTTYASFTTFHVEGVPQTNEVAHCGSGIDASIFFKEPS